MALPLTNTFEGGSDETVVSAANSGGASGNAFNSVYNPGASTIKFDNARSSDGTMSIRVDNNAAGAPTLVIWSSASVGTPTEMWGRFYLWRDTAAVNMRALQLENAGARAFALDFLSNGKIRVWDNGSVLGDSVSALTTQQWIRVEFHVVHSATVGSVEVKYFNLHQTTPIETLSYTNKNTLAQSNTVAVGQYLTETSAFSSWIDGLTVNATGYPGPSQTLTLDSCLPDADIVTTGWSTAPLFSKVNDDSDATVITATAS